MFRAGTIAPAADAAPPRDAASRRLAAGLLVSLLAHALILSLQFGLPGMALQGARSAIDITLAHVLPPTQLQADPVAPDSVLPAPPLPPPAPVTGMRLVDPVARPAPRPPPRPAVVRKDKPRKARRVSAPLPQPEADAPVRVIAQASNPGSEFVVPLPQPEEPVQKTIDPAEAQHGSDAVAEAQPDDAPLPELEQPLLARREAEAQLKKATDEERLAAATERDALAQQRLAQENAKRQELDEQLSQQRLAREAMERQKSEELLAQQRREQELIERKKVEEQLAQQRLAQELAQRQRQEELAQARAAAAGNPSGAAHGQGADGASKAAAGNDGSKLANRVRELSKGLDLLTGAPPPRPRPDSERQPRRVVVDNAERDLPLRMYVESWRQKIERNGGMNFPKLIGARARIDPLVSVAVRSDGSIEDVTIVRSSGRQDTDEAVRRIVRINALYSKFPPNIASRYDVVEIRRVWTFDQVLKLIEEVR